MTRVIGRQTLHTTLLLLVPGAFLVAFFVVPLLNSVAVSVDGTSLSMAGYRRLVDVPVYRNVYLRTLKVAVLTTLICLALGYPCAYWISRQPPRRRAIIVSLIAFPFMLSVLVRNYVWMTLLQDTGLINRALLGLGWTDAPIRLMHNELGVLIAMVNMLVPYVIFPVLGALLALPRDLELASAGLGADKARTFVRIVLPLTAAGTAAGCLLTFIVALGFYITPAMLGGTRELLVANLIAFNVREVLNWAFAFSLSTTLLISTLVLYVAYRAIMPGATLLKAS